MTLGEWLNQMILEDGPEGQAPEPEPIRRPTLASPRLGRLEALPAQGDELDRVLEGLDRLSARIEAAEHRSTLAISGIDQSVQGVLSRMETAEREQIQVAARFEGALDETRTDQARIAERLRRIEQESVGPRSAEALRALELALNKVAGQLYEGETRTREAIGVLRRDLDQVAQKAAAVDASAPVLVDAVVARIAERLEKAEAGTTGAIRALESSFASLDGRLSATEATLERSGGADARFEQLANELSQKMEQSRLVLVEQIKASADGRADRLERTLRDMAAHVQVAERKSAHAIETMGKEVLQMADSLNQKLQASEHRNAEAVDQIGAEVARVANAVEQRLRRVDSGHAEALEKLGSEIARITERLAERIAGAERRSAHAVDDVGEQMARITERINQRQERSSSELLDRMRQSEERTARLLEEARERIDRRLGETAKRAAEPIPEPAAPAPQIRPPYAEPPSAFGPSAFADPFAAIAPQADSFDEAFAPPPTVHDSAFAAPPFDATGSFDIADFPADSDTPTFAEEDFDAAQGFGRETDAYDSVEPLDASADFEAAPTRSASTRELIAAARAAARQASQPAEKENKPRGDSGGGGLLGNFGKKKEAGSFKNALLASSIVAVLGLSAAGYVIYRPDMVAGWNNGGHKAPLAVQPQQTSQTASSAPSSEAMAANLTLDAPSAPDAAPVAAPPPDSSDIYNQAKDKIKANDPAGLDLMRKAANVGYAPAQFYMAKLYEDGDAGVKKDPAEARRWTQRAAEGGDPKAMHNLGLYYFHGDGGPKNVAQAATWFRRAADLGLVDSQYNLAQLYEEGLGVSQNPAEAYKWFLIAAKSGDGESKASADRLKGQLSVSAQQAADRAASAFRPESAAPQAPVATAANPVSDADKVNLAMAQKALSKLGYYKGPADGANSPALRLAIASYQKTLGEPADGALNPELIGKFTAITR
ncbi:MAG TPA: peptidoglycan-binding protein [Caulobacteraceae bacterium]|nr:peptidoglycan-binding protein [Caulobacteraceae bacterium]